MVKSRTAAVITVGAGITAGVSALQYLRSRSPRRLLDTEINSHLEVASGNCKVVVVECPGDWNRVVGEVKNHLTRLPVLGLDCEWVSDGGQARPVCLLQLATCCGLAVLIRLTRMSQLPSSLKEILAAFDVYKVGVAIGDDNCKLMADYGLDVGGSVDLRHLVLAYRQKGEKHPGKLGLESLASQFLGVTLDKDWRLRAGDWEVETLSARQIDYAANDALVAVNILWTILNRYFSNTWLRSISCDLWSQSRLETEVVTALEQFVDLKFNNKEWKLSLRSSKEKSGSPAPAKTLRTQNSVRKSPLYHNCMLQAPDGQILCTCDIKKAQWYLKQDIGFVVSEDPFIVRLKFEPSGRPEGKAGEYYMSVKPNICVVCGKDDAYLRKNVVPHEYRRYFPAVMKDHQSHDVLLMCVQCHQISNIHDGHLRKILADECGAPVGCPEESVKLKENWDLKKLRSAGRALQANRKKGKIPAGRLTELESVLLDHYNVTKEELTDELIDEAASANFLEQNGDYIPHSRATVQYYLESDSLSLLALETRWRKHFLETMKPKFLPDLWSVDHQAERLEVKAKENRIDLQQYKLATEGVSKDEDFDLEEYRSSVQVQLGINPDAQRRSRSRTISRER